MSSEIIDKIENKEKSIISTENENYFDKRSNRSCNELINLKNRDNKKTTFNIPNQQPKNETKNIIEKNQRLNTNLMFSYSPEERSNTLYQKYKQSNKHSIPSKNILKIGLSQNNNTTLTNNINQNTTTISNENITENNNNNPNSNESIYTHKVNIHKICLKKNLDPLKIPEEDQIFMQLVTLDKKIKLHNNLLKSRTRNKTVGNKGLTENINKKMNFQQINQGLKKMNKNKISLKTYEHSLFKVYKKIPVTLNKIENIKKMKNSFDLLDYQNLLLKVGSKTLPKESRLNLNEKFITIRKKSEKKYGLFKESLKDIERKEERIITMINKQNKIYNKTMSPWVKESKGGFSLNNPNYLPEIRFVKTPNYMLSPFKGKRKNKLGIDLNKKISESKSKNGSKGKNKDKMKI